VVVQNLLPVKLVVGGGLVGYLGCALLSGLKILCLVPSLGDWKATVGSVFCQTVEPSLVLVLTERVAGGVRFPAKMSLVLNNGLEGVDLSRFDYVLRVDDDTVLPRNFVEENLRGFPDVVGLGNAMLIRVSSFLRVMGGRFFVEHDDSYVWFKFASLGLLCQDYVVKPVLVRGAGCGHGVRYFVERGEFMFQFGYEPFHVLVKVLLDRMNLFMLVGYFRALLLRYPKFDVAGYVGWLQVQRFLHPLRSLRKAKRYIKKD
jgi:hypothetical protein